MSIVSPSFRSIVPPPLPSSNSSIRYFFSACQNTVGSKVIYTSFTLVNVALLPLYVSILFMGFQRWRSWRSARTGTPISHSDFFTFQMMIVEILGVLGSVLYTLGSHIKSVNTILGGVYCFGCIFSGQTLFHVLTCVERYLAVVHAITFIQLRETIKLRVRNISTVVVWLVNFGWMALLKLYLPAFPTLPLLPVLAVSLFVTGFCCLSVLRFLTHPGPGTVSGNHGRVDPSKKRAFNMILAITVSLVLRILGLLVVFGIDNLVSMDEKDLCVLMDSGIWLTVPSSLVLPLLFLHRAGKIPCCRKKTKS